MACATKAAPRKLGQWWDDQIDRLFDRAGRVLGDWDRRLTGNRLVLDETLRGLGRVEEEYKVAMGDIYQSGGELKAALDGLNKEDSQGLVRVLGGDAEATELSADLMPLYERLRAAIDKNADALVQAGALDEKYKIEHYLKRYYAKFLTDKEKADKLYFSERFQGRKDLTMDERIALGMIEDASFVVPKTIVEQRFQLLKANSLKALADRFGREQPAATDWVQVPTIDAGGGVKRYGALSGKWVDPRVWRYMQETAIFKEELGALEKWLFPTVDHLKVNLTVKNPMTHLYNTGSNLMLAFLHGHYGALGRLLNTAGRHPDKFREITRLANKYGLNTNLDYIDPQTIVFDAPAAKLPNVAKSILKNLYMAKGSKTGDAMRFLYDWEDKFFKVAAFADGVEKHAKALGRGLEPAELRALAREANELYVNYQSPLPTAIRAVDKYGVMPFLHYTYKATPMVAKAVAKHPIRFAIMQAALLGVGGSAWLGDNDDDLKPAWAADQFNLFGVKEWVQLGNGWYLNAGRLMPGIRFGVELDINMGFGFWGSAVKIAGGETPLGYPISGKYDPLQEQVTDRLLAAAENFLPPMTFGRYGQRLVAIAAGEPRQNYYGEDLLAGETLLRGAGVRRFNPQAELERKNKEAANALRYHERQAKERGKPQAAQAAKERHRETTDRLKQSAQKAGVRMAQAQEDFPRPIRLSLD